MFATVFVLAFVVGLIVTNWKPKAIEVRTEPDENWMFEPVDGPGWFKFTGEVARE